MTRLPRRLSFACLACLLGAQLALSVVSASRTAGADFGKLYFGWQQGNLYARTPASFDVWPGHDDPWYRNLNPPHVFLIVWPLVHLPVHTAWMCWLVLQVATIAAIVCFIIRRGSGSGWPATP